MVFIDFGSKTIEKAKQNKLFIEILVFFFRDPNFFPRDLWSGADPGQPRDLTQAIPDQICNDFLGRCYLKVIHNWSGGRRRKLFPLGPSGQPWQSLGRKFGSRKKKGFP